MGTVSRAMSLLALFNEDRLSLGLSEVARLAKIDKATAHRSLVALRDAGMIEQFGPDKAYRIGPEVLRLANIREAAAPIMECARAILEKLCIETGETTHFSVLRGKRLISVAHEYSRQHATGVMMGGGDSHPVHATSSGLALLAFSEERFVKAILSKPLEEFTAATKTNPDEVLNLAQKVCKQGYAEVNGAYEEGVHSFSAPVFDREGKPTGALSVTAPAARVKTGERKKFSQAVMAASALMTRQTGGVFPPNYPTHVIDTETRPQAA